MPALEAKHFFAKIENVDEDLGLVFGFAIVCEEYKTYKVKKGNEEIEEGRYEPYYDLQGDHIPESSMLKAANNFMANSCIVKDMHEGDQVGTAIFAWPMTKDIAKAMDIKTSKTGLMVGMKIDNKELLDKFKTGEYTGFSIGGLRISDEEVD